jgi:hypothetical protein
VKLPDPVIRIPFVVINPALVEDILVSIKNKTMHIGYFQQLKVYVPHNQLLHTSILFQKRLTKLVFWEIIILLLIGRAVGPCCPLAEGICKLYVGIFDH